MSGTYEEFMTTRLPARMKLDLLSLIAKLEGIYDKWFLITIYRERVIAKYYAMVLNAMVEADSLGHLCSFYESLDRPGLDAMTLQVYVGLDEILDAYKG